MRFSSLSFFYSLIPLSLYAAELPPLTSLNEEMSYTEQLATQTNQNIDYQPFILSVWEQKDLIPFGVHTLKDALMLLPGIDMMANTNNNRTPVIRGSNPLAYGQTKLAIDGVVVNDRSADTYTGYLDFPIELIQRIEIVRGAGSFIEGVNGYSGSINVITYAKDENKLQNGALFGSFGSDSARQAGFWYTHRASKWRLSSDFFYQSNDALSPIKVTDKYHKVGYAPLNSEQVGFGLSYFYDDFYLKGRFNHFTTGSAFGNLSALPNREGEQTFPSWYVEGGYTHKVSNALTINAKAGIMEDGWEEDSRLLPPGTIYNTIPFPNGFWADLSFETRMLYATISADYTGIKNHKITAGYTQKYEDIIDMSTVTTNKSGGSTLVDYTVTAPFIDAGSACRHTDEFYLNDTIDINSQIALSLNLGGTKASNLDVEPYARAALVYQPYRQHIVKFMVGNSFRLPSFRELYSQNNPQQIGNPNLEAEHVISYETQYLYKPTVDTTIGVNLFYLRNKDQITPNTTNKMYQNIGERNIKGVETEFRGSIGENDLTFLSYSYIRGETIKGNETTDYLPYASTHLLKGGLSYALTPQIKAAILGRYSSEKERRPNDSRKNSMESFASYDLILGWEDPSGFYIQGALKNANNAIYRYIAPPSTYPDDYPIEGRTFWIRTGWKF
ncbi:TonB-dependent receptor [Sulfuricurvum sp.]|uniref:TonB-dependent receptor plug domain-containing protein n=1 Tax=Sulfuricurvum sp. TaxID=2025608 RepID=UPI0025D86745|nr:TonB-dependent receptor [Sulfuricurvum sp.]